jgi:hypothetical protein
MAAAYRLLDLWYAIGTRWPAVARGITIWVGGTAAIAWLLPEARRPAFLWGATAYLVFSIVSYFILWRVLIPRYVAHNLGRNELGTQK